MAYKVVTKDQYELTIHRLIHPSDFATNGPQRSRPKKPYLLLHGLVGTSASYVTNVQDNYRAPPNTYNPRTAINQNLLNMSPDYKHDWRSTAEHERRASNSEPVGTWDKRKKVYSYLNKIDFGGDKLVFGQQFDQAYRKFELPNEAIDYTSNSLAFTLSNFGYDVWLINLRGNAYSRKHTGRLSASDPEYWDFGIDKIISEDLMAVINFVQKVVDCDEPVGFVSHSYTSIHVLGLLTKDPKYQERLQPVIMMAPTLLTGTHERTKLKYFMRTISKYFMSKNGPYPAIGRDKSEHKIENLICNLPIASKLCRLLETILYGETKKVKSVSGLIFNSRKTSLMKRDVDCGQTSKATLHEIVQNLSTMAVNPKYMPFVTAKRREMSGELTRRSVILVHSKSDEISTMEEVDKIRDTALKTMALVDYVVIEPNFSHTDFLFSRRNQYTVNAEIARMAILYDFLLYRKSANQPAQVARGY